MITVIYVAKLADLLGVAEEQINWHGGTTADLLAQLRGRNDDYAAALSAQNVYKLAVNQAIIHSETALNDGDCVALLPPVTGG